MLKLNVRWSECFILLACLFIPTLAFADFPVAGGGGGTVSITDNSITPANLQSSEGTADGTTYYRGDGAWGSPSGVGGDVQGGATSADGEMAVYNGTGGKTIKRSLFVLAGPSATAKTYTFPNSNATIWTNLDNGVVGPVGGSTDTFFAYWDGTNGRLLKDGQSSVNPTFNSINITGATGVAVGGPTAGLQGRIVLKSGVAANSNTFTIVTDNTGGGLGASLSWILPKAAPGGANYLINADADGTVGYTDPSTLGGDDLGAAAASDVVALFSGSGDYLKSDGTQGTPNGAGTVNGPASVTENHVVTWGADNTAIKDGGVLGTLAAMDNGAMTTTKYCIYTTGVGIVCNSTPAGGITAISEDTSPSLGGDLDGMGFSIDNVSQLNFAQGATGGEVRLLEGVGGGTEYIGLVAPDALANTYRLVLPVAAPSTEAMVCGPPTDNISVCIWQALSAGSGDMTQAVYDANTDNVVDTAAALSAQYIDWNAGSGATSIANKPTLGTIVTLNQGTMTDNTYCKFDTEDGVVCNYSAVAGNPFDQDLNTNDNAVFNSVSTGTSASTAGFVEMFEKSGTGGESVKITAADSLTDNVTITVSSTSVDFGALNFVTTGAISGAIPVLDNVANPTAAQMYGSNNVVNAAITVLLPTAVGGMSGCITDGAAAATDIIVDVQAGDNVVLTGVVQDGGVGITNASGSSLGDYVCFIATAANKWRVYGKVGTWVSQ